MMQFCNFSLRKCTSRWANSVSQRNTTRRLPSSMQRYALSFPSNFSFFALIYAKVCSKFSFKLFFLCSLLCKVGFCFPFFNFSCRCSLLCTCFSNFFLSLLFFFCYQLCKGCSKFFPFQTFIVQGPRGGRCLLFLNDAMFSNS